MSNKIIRVARKEFLDMFRDRRSLIRMMAIPLVAFPIIINLVVTISSTQSEKAKKKVLKVGYVLNGQDEALINRISEEKYYEFIAYDDSADMRKDVKGEKINLGLVFHKDFDNDYSGDRTAKLSPIYRMADMEEYERLKDILNEQDSIMTAQRLTEKDLEPELTQAFELHDPPIKISPTEWGLAGNVSDKQEVIGKYGGGLLPYIFIAFCFMGCMYPAIDLFAGEKERGTLETLLTTPVNRTHVLLGKMIVIVCFGLLSATLALAGLFLSLNMVDIGDDMMQAINKILSPDLIVTLYVLLVPMAIFFAGVMTPISVYAKSFKEAQSIMVPLNIVIVLPAMVGFIPSVELDYVTAFIPMVNVVLATKQIIGQNVDIALIAITFVSLILLAGVAMYLSLRQFDKESNILRGD